MVLEKTLESPLDSKEIKPVFFFFFNLKKIIHVFPILKPEFSLEGLMLKLKLQYFGHLIEQEDSLEKSLLLGAGGRLKAKGEEGGRG